MEKIVQESNLSIWGLGFWVFPPKSFETVQRRFNLFSVHGVALMYLINDQSFSKKSNGKVFLWGLHL